jgi:uncharacterized protein YjbI with pentapeptide repeats
MANEEQLSILREGVDIWNKWRDENLFLGIDLSGADLRGTDLSEANLSVTEPSEANLRRANLSEDRLNNEISFRGVDIRRANLSEAKLNKTHLGGADIRKANFSGADLNGASLMMANLSESNLREANLRKADLWGACFREADLSRADLREADLREADLSRADLREANLREANLSRANLSEANLSEANLSRVDLSEAELSGASLNLANLILVNLRGANLRRANLFGSNMIQANIDSVIISKSNVYGINVWDLEGEFADQKELIITRDGESAITVDNIEIAQFIYLILNNRKIRDVINTLTSKTVLILGRFAIPERKAILDALRNKLREYDLLPIVFDFDRPADKDFTETIKTLAGISYFVIADVTNPKSSPLELQATVPDYQIPFVPIIQEGESPFSLMVDLQSKYPWVLPTRSYDSIETLMSALKSGIIDPAVEMRNKLRLIKAQEQTTESLKDYLDKTL